MGYRSDVRIITSKEGFEKLKEFVKNYLKEHNEEYNLLEECDIKKQGKEQYYFGWNYLKWYDGYVDVDSIMQGLKYLEENEYSYRYMRIGESYEDIEEQSYDGDKDKNIYLEYLSMTREFDDEYVQDLIKTNEKTTELEENKESIDI